MNVKSKPLLQEQEKKHYHQRQQNDTDSLEIGILDLIYIKVEQLYSYYPTNATSDSTSRKLFRCRIL